MPVPNVLKNLKSFVALASLQSFNSVFVLVKLIPFVNRINPFERLGSVDVGQMLYSLYLPERY